MIVVGAESGPKARPCDPAWLRSLRDQCAAARVPFFAKQFSGPGGLAVSDPARFPAGEWPRQMPEVRP